MPDESDVKVPEEIDPNILTTRNLTPYYQGDAGDLVQEELVGPQQHQLGVVPKQLSRAGRSAIGAGVINKALGTGELVSSAVQAGADTLSAPVRPDRLPGKAQKVTDFLEMSADPKLTREQADAALKGAGGAFGRLMIAMQDTARPYVNAYNEYKYPSSQAAEAAGKRLAKAKRKKKRRNADSVSLYDRFVRPFKEDARVSRQVRKQMDKGGPIQLTVPPPKQEN
jgi:hypothetical protein